MVKKQTNNDYTFFQTPKILKYLEPSSWALFCVLFDEWKMMKNEDGWFYRSEKELSVDSGMSESTIKRHTKELEKIGLVEVVRHNEGRKNGKAVYDKANDYKIIMEKVVKLNTFNDGKGGQIEKEGGQIDLPTNNKETNNKYQLTNNKETEMSELEKDLGF